MAAPEAKDFVEAIAPAVRQAAAIARGLEGRVANRPKSGERSDVKAALTIADTASQEAILVRLYDKFPQVGLEAEEDTPTARRFPQRSDPLVVIDPIDGTLRSYLEGRGAYAVMVGLAVADRFTAGLVALPREGLIFDAVAGGGARIFREDEEPRSANLSEPGRNLMVSYDLPPAVERVLEERGYELQYGSGGAVAVAPLIPGVCGGLRIVGTERISRRGRIGVLASREAGALIRSEHGEFPEALDAPARALLVADSQETLGDLQAALDAADL